jgi:signal transduction histidine kinase
MARERAPKSTGLDTSLLSHLETGVLVSSLQGSILTVNPAWGKLTGLPSLRLIGKRLRTAFPPRLRSPMESLLNELRRKRGSVELTLTDGRLRLKGLPWKGGYLFLLDHHRRGETAEKRRLKQQLLASERLAGIGQLASGIAHELNNPMATIASCAEALLKRTQDPQSRFHGAEDLRLYLRIIEEEVYRCKGILAGLSDLSREGGGERRLIDLHTLLEGILTLLGYQLRTREITLVREFHPGLPLLMGHEGELRQAILAILINALEAMEKGGTLTLRARVVGLGGRGTKRSPPAARYPRPVEWVQVEIEDAGRGIPRNLLPKIFEPFFSTKPPEKGAGLGLYLAEGFVKAHGGKIEVESVEGKGTVVRVHLPPAKA